MKILLLALALITTAALAGTGACNSMQSSNTCVFYEAPDFLIEGLKTGCTGDSGKWVESCPADGFVCELNQADFNLDVYLYSVSEEQAKQGCSAMGGDFVGKE